MKQTNFEQTEQEAQIEKNKSSGEGFFKDLEKKKSAMTNQNNKESQRRSWRKECYSPKKHPYVKSL